jgi:preprotein translocase subunit YajC
VELLIQLAPFLFLIAIMYFIIIRPQQNESKKKKEMLEALKKGDKIITIGGVYATIYKVEEDGFLININDKTTVKITKESIFKKREDEA